MGPTRFHWFLIASAALICAVVVVCGAVVGWVLERQVLAQEEHHTATVVRGQARLRLVRADFELADSGGKRGRLEAFLHALPEVFRIKVFDRSGTIVWSNESRLVGKRFPDNLNLAKALQGEVTMVLEPPKRSEHVYERSRGYVAEAYVPITLTGSAGIVGVVETYTDAMQVIVGIRRAQQLMWAVAASLGALLYVALGFVVWRARANELQAMRHLETERRLASLGRLAAGISHELRNPLSVIVGRVELLQHEMTQARFSAPNLGSQLAKMEDAAHRMTRIVQSLSTYSTPPRPQPTLLNISELLGATEELLALQARESRVTIDVDSPAHPPRVWGDRSQLMQVLLNLATNAIEAMAGTGGQLTLKARLQYEGPNGQGTGESSAPRGFVWVEVSDTGPGIPPEFLQKIWEPFHTTKPAGTGLGLSIVRSLVAEQPGAKIAVESRPGKGTTFTLTLPVADKEPQVSEPSSGEMLRPQAVSL